MFKYKKKTLYNEKSIAKLTVLLMFLTLILFFTNLFQTGIKISAISGYWTSSTSLPNGGGNSSGDPFLISKPQELAYLIDKSNFYAKLVCNIDLQDKYWVPITNFQNSTIEGNGFAINNMVIDDSANTDLGFIEKSNKSNINNLTISGSVTAKKTFSNTSTGTITVGGFIANSTGTNITNCISNVTVSVTGRSNQKYAGGFAGQATTTNFNYCTNLKDIRTPNSNFDYNCDVGGIVGKINSGTLKLCSNQATIISGNNAGGIAGVSNIEISESYNMGYIIAGTGSTSNITRAGGICGYVANASVIKNCYNTGPVSAQKASGSENRTNITSTAFNGYSYYDNWDVWHSRTILDLVNGISPETLTYLYLYSDYDSYYKADNLKQLNYLMNNGYLTEGINTTLHDRQRFAYVPRWVKTYNTEAYAGGICGVNSANITNSYNIGYINSNGSYKVESQYGFGQQMNDYNYYKIHIIRSSASIPYYNEISGLNKCDVTCISDSYVENQDYLPVGKLTIEYEGCINYAGNRNQLKVNLIQDFSTKNYVLNTNYPFATYTLRTASDGHDLSLYFYYDFNNNGTLSTYISINSQMYSSLQLFDNNFSGLSQNYIVRRYTSSDCIQNYVGTYLPSAYFIYDTSISAYPILKNFYWKYV